MNLKLHPKHYFIIFQIVSCKNLKITERVNSNNSIQQSRQLHLNQSFPRTVQFETPFFKSKDSGVSSPTPFARTHVINAGLSWQMGALGPYASHLWEWPPNPHIYISPLLINGEFRGKYRSDGDHHSFDSGVLHSSLKGFSGR